MAPVVTSASRLPTSSRTKAITIKAPHFGTPILRIQRSIGVATMAMNTASRMGTRIDAADSRTVTTRAKAPATSRPRAGALNARLDVMDCSPQITEANFSIGFVETRRLP